MLGVNVLGGLGELRVSERIGKPDDLAFRKSMLHNVLLKHATLARDQASNYYSKATNEVDYEVGDLVLLRDCELSIKDGNKVACLWIYPYNVTAKI